MHTLHPVTNRVGIKSFSSFSRRSCHPFLVHSAPGFLLGTVRRSDNHRRQKLFNFFLDDVMDFWITRLDAVTEWIAIDITFEQTKKLLEELFFTKPIIEVYSVCSHMIGNSRVLVSLVQVECNGLLPSRRVISPLYYSIKAHDWSLRNSSRESKVLGGLAQNQRPQNLLEIGTFPPLHSLQRYRLVQRLNSPLIQASCKSGLPLSKEDLLSEISPMFSDQWCKLKALPGAYRLINHLRGHGVKMALASNSPRDSIETKISYHPGWKESFSVIIGGDEVKEGKPSPKIFLEADKRLSIAAAKAAEMDVVVVPSLPLKKNDLRKAYEKCKDIPQESRALIDTFLKEESDKDYEMNLSIKLPKAIPLTPEKPPMPPISSFSTGGSSSQQHTHQPMSPISSFPTVDESIDEHEIGDEYLTNGYLTEKEQQQLLLDEKALRETLEEEARAEKEWEERIKQEQAHDELFRLEFRVKSYSEYESD
ncbi:bifunctional riboflavin kinase/FMN phosphatase [Tanacetum coccineum]|uniref:Bifunctional riboflavin kinase/FMN phosphatase n=1 Tax=Tanacetum coccineum TaxID=301880 RepID=A0ABQ5CBD8_9ASTR